MIVQRGLLGFVAVLASVCCWPEQCWGEPACRVLHLIAKEPPASVQVAYRWNAQEPALRKFTTINNDSTHAWDRLLNVRLGRYDAAGVTVIDVLRRVDRRTSDQCEPPFMAW